MAESGLAGAGGREALEEAGRLVFVDEMGVGANTSLAPLHASWSRQGERVLHLWALRRNRQKNTTRCLRA